MSLGKVLIISLKHLNVYIGELGEVTLDRGVKLCWGSRCWECSGMRFGGCQWWTCPPSARRDFRMTCVWRIGFPPKNTSMNAKHTAGCMPHSGFQGACWTSVEKRQSVSIVGSPNLPGVSTCPPAPATDRKWHARSCYAPAKWQRLMRAKLQVRAVTWWQKNVLISCAAFSKRKYIKTKPTTHSCFAETNGLLIS